MPTIQEIQGWLAANPTATDADIRAAMDQYGASTDLMAQATGLNLADVQSRYEAAAPVIPAPAPVYTPPAYEPPAYDPYSDYSRDQVWELESAGVDPYDQYAAQDYFAVQSAPPPTVTTSEAQIRDLYQRYFNRAPDPEGLAFWVTAGQNGYTPEMIEAEFASSPEYTALQAAQQGTEVTVSDIQQWLAQHPNATDYDIRQAMDQYGVSPELMAQATGLDPGTVQSRYDAAVPAVDTVQDLADSGLVEDAADVLAAPDVGKLKEQLLAQWGQINPEYLAGTLKQSGLTLDQLADKFAQQAASAGITDLGQLTLGTKTEKLAGAETETGTTYADVVRNYLSAGDKQIGYIGEGNAQEYLDDPEALNRALYSYAFKDPTSAGRLFGTAEGEGWTAGEVIQGPDGKLMIVPTWGSSSDAADILKAAQLGLMFVPGAGAGLGSLISSGAGLGLGALGQTVLGNALIGGTMSELAGGDFLKGAATSALSAGLTSGVSDVLGSSLKDIGSSVASYTGSQVVGDAVTKALERGLSSGATALLTGNSALDAAVNSAVQGFVGSAATGLTSEALADVPAPVRDAVTSAAMAVAQGGDFEAATQAALKSLVQSTVNQLKTDEKTAQTIANAYADKSRGQDVLGNQGAYDYTSPEVKAAEEALNRDVLDQLVYDGSDYQDFDDAIANARAEGYTQVKDASGNVYNLTQSTATSETVDRAMQKEVAEQLVYDGTDYADFDDAVANAKAEGFTQVRGPDGNVYNIGSAAPTSADVLAVAKDFSGYTSFNSAYGAARELLGPNQTFTYNGKEYSTATAAERPDLSGKSDWVTPEPVTGDDSIAQVKTYLGGLLGNPDFNPADLKAGEMSAFVDAYAKATPAQRQAMLQGTDRATFAVIDDLLKKSPGALATQAVPEGTHELKAPPTTFKDVANDVGAFIGGMTFKAVGEGAKLAGVAGNWMGADPDNVVYNFGKAVHAFGSELSPTSVADQQKNIIDAVNSATGDTPFEAGLNKLGAAVASSIQNPLGLADWIGTELIQEMIPLTAAVKVGKAVTAASKLAFGEKIASTFGLGSAIAIDATLNAGESATASYDEVYRKLKEAGVSEEAAVSAASKAAITAGAATLFTSAIGDSKIIGSLLDVAKGAAVKSVAREAPTEYLEGFIQSLGDQYFATGDVNLNQALTGATIESLVGSGTSGAIGAGIDVSSLAGGSGGDTDITPFVPAVGGTGGGGADIGSKPDDIGDIDEDKSGDEGQLPSTQAVADQPVLSSDDIIQKLEDSGLQLVDNAAQIIADYTNEVLGGGDISTSGLTADTVIAIDVDGNQITAGDLGLISTTPTSAADVGKDGVTPVGAQTQTDPATGVQTTTSVDAKTNTQTQTVTDPATNTQTQTTTDANTGVESTTTINNNTNTQSTVTTDPNTNTQTQTTTDNNTNVTTKVTTDPNTNVTTTVKTDPNTNTTTTVTTDPNTNTTTETTTNTNTNTETTVTTNTETGLKITTKTDLATGETVVTDVDFVDATDVVSPEDGKPSPEGQPPVKPTTPTKPKTPAKAATPFIFAPQVQQQAAPMAAPALANVFYAGAIEPGISQSAASVTDFQAQKKKLAAALGSKSVADDVESDENDERAQQSEQLRQIFAAIDGQEDFANVDELMQYVMRG